MREREIQKQFKVLQQEIALAGEDLEALRRDQRALMDGLRLEVEALWNACIRCHVMVPHGYRVSRLMGDRSASMPDRYAFDNDWHNMYISDFTKRTDPVVTPINPAGYGYYDCSTGGGNCHVF
jgi:hypothetical protein